MKQKTYILQKDLPYTKAGTEYFKNTDFDNRVDRNSYFPNKVGSRCERFAIHADYVENNPEWFKLKEEKKQEINLVLSTYKNSMTGVTIYNYQINLHERLSDNVVNKIQEAIQKIVNDEN